MNCKHLSFPIESIFPTYILKNADKILATVRFPFKSVGCVAVLIVLTLETLDN